MLLTVLVAGCGGGGVDREPPAPVSAPASAPAPVTTSVAVQAPHNLVFSAEGDAEVVSIVYELDGESSTEESVSLPWRKTVEVPADGRQHRWNLTLTHRGGYAELIAIFDGAVTGRTEGSGSGTGTLEVSGTVRG